MHNTSVCVRREPRRDRVVSSTFTHFKTFKKKKQRNKTLLPRCSLSGWPLHSCVGPQRTLRFLLVLSARSKQGSELLLQHSCLAVPLTHCPPGALRPWEAMDESTQRPLGCSMRGAGVAPHRQMATCWLHSVWMFKSPFHKHPSDNLCF